MFEKTKLQSRSNMDRLNILKFCLLSNKSQTELMNELPESNKIKISEKIDNIPMNISNQVRKLSSEKLKALFERSSEEDKGCLENNQENILPSFLDLLKVEERVTPATKKMIERMHGTLLEQNNIASVSSDSIAEVSVEND